MRALIVSYLFPPVGGAGVARVSKLTKFLPELGVEPTVLTVENPSVPVMDESRGADLPAGTRVVKARTFEPGFQVKQAAWKASASSPAAGAAGALASWKKRAVALAKSALVPDPQVLWQPAAQLTLARLLAREKVDVVFISGPPFSQFLLAPLARLRRGAAVVLDYRDEWSTYRTTYEMMGKLSAAVGGPLEHGLLRCAHAVTTATEAFRENLLARFPFVAPETVRAIPNGYDPDDLPRDLPAPPSDKFVLTYAGTIFKLTSARGLLGAIRRLHAAEPKLARRLEVRFLGRVVDTELDAFEGTEAMGVVREGYVPHAQVAPALARSHMVLCLLDDVPGVERIYPAKIFELMLIRRPCLTLAPAGELVDLVRAHHLGDVIPPRDEQQICAFLVEKLRAFEAGQAPPAMAPVDIERYHRRAQAAEFVNVFREAKSRATR